MQIAQALARAREQLAAIDSAALDAEVLLAWCLDKPRSHLHAWPEKALDAGVEKAFFELIAKRADHIPVSYLTGKREFWSLELCVTPDTLIPRPETELLVELTLQSIPPDQAFRLADLGTGSGAIALALAHERPNAEVLATDLSAAALAMARNNAQRLHINNVAFAEGDWMKALPGEPFDLLVSNPPYIAEHDAHLSQGDVQHEPRSALSSGPDGLDDIRQLIAAAPEFLKPGGQLLLEHGHDQQAAIMALMQKDFVNVTGHRDAAGVDRVVSGCLHE